MNTIGNTLQLTIFGASHTKCVGCILSGVPAGVFIDMDQVREDLALRKPTPLIGTSRVELDVPMIKNLSSKNETTGDEIIITFKNENVLSSDYDLFRTIPRPGHADYPALVKYGDGYDIRGGGIFSGRMTAPLVAAGAVLRNFISETGVNVGSYTKSIGDVSDENIYEPYDIMKLSRENPLRAMNSAVAERMREKILSAKNFGDSIGGVVRCVATGVPVGVGEPFFDTLDGEVAKAVFAVPGVKGVSFGEGFSAAKLFGSQNNDAYTIQNGKVVTKTNHSGGVLGGMANGAPLDFSVAFKPTPSISREQESVNLSTLTDTKLSISGRHDPCIVPRAAIVIEAVTIFTLADLLMRGGYLE